MAGSMQGCRMSSKWEASPPALHGVQAPLYMQLKSKTYQTIDQKRLTISLKI